VRIPPVLALLSLALLSEAAPSCDSVEVHRLPAFLAAEDTPWGQIPGVVLVGILMGLGFLIVAIRAMFKKK
jgi:hypothetical protein